MDARRWLSDSEAGAVALRQREYSDEECDRQAERSKALNLGQYLQKGYHGPWWTEEEKQLLGTDTDEAIAARIRRTKEAVRRMRCQLGFPNPLDRRRREHRPAPAQSPESWVDRLGQRHKLTDF